MPTPPETARPRVATITLGCKANQYESGRIAEELWQAGFEVGTPADSLDVVVVNTCSVTHLADAKSRQQIRKLRRRNPRVLLAVTGCGTEADQGGVAGVEELDLVIPNRRKDRAAQEILSAFHTRSGYLPAARESELVRRSDRTRALLMVQDGCDYHCSFCIIPYTRHAPRSRSFAELMAEAARLAAAGFREIILTGICIGTWTSEGLRIPQLIDALCKVDGLERLRISSIEPQDLTDELLEAIARNPKVCRHLHAPLQSGSDKVLRQMNRRYTSTQYLGRLEAAKRMLPGCALTTDLMVGFPGETEEEFEATRHLCATAGFSRLHVFPYSRRLGTPAAARPDQVPEDVREARTSVMLLLGRELCKGFAEKNVGRTLSVLVEGDQSEDGRCSGYSDTYLRVTFQGGSDLRGRIVPVRVTTLAGDSALGELAG
jgi:threonylcarbamoyladenosine tRNA methylthiotransferase MtaB